MNGVSYSVYRPACDDGLEALGRRNFVRLFARLHAIDLRARPKAPRWSAVTVDGRELSTYDARASQAYRRLRAIAPLRAGSFARCTRPDFASRAQITEDPRRRAGEV